MSFYRGAHRVALADAETAGGVLSVANPEGVPLIITRLIVNLTTASAGAGTVDFGIAADGTTLAAELIDGLDVNAATGVFDNIDDQGASGQSLQPWGVDEFVTGSAASGAAAGLEGFAYIEYLHQ